MLRVLAASWLLLAVGCAEGGYMTTVRNPDGGGQLVSPDGGPYQALNPDLPWDIRVDSTGTDSYVRGYPAAVGVSGQAYATQGISHVDVAGFRGNDPSGVFSVSVPIQPGLNMVPIEAFDGMENSRKANRTLISADFLPEGTVNPGAASVVLSNEIVATMAASLQGMIAALDLRPAILARSPLLADETCTLYPSTATHGTAELTIAISATGSLDVRVIVPALVVNFSGTCSAPILGSFNVAGSMSTSIYIYSSLSAPPSDQCIVGLQHSYPTVELQNFDVTLSTGGANWLVDLLIGAIANGREGDTGAMLSTEFAAQADALFNAQLAGISVFDSQQQLDLFGKTLNVGLCLTGMYAEGGQLRARVGAQATGSGGVVTGPGAPVLPGELPPVTPKTMWLDANLVSQFLFAAWQAGGFRQENVQMLPGSLIGVLAPDLRGMFAADAQLSVSMDATLPPVVRAYIPPAGVADPAMGQGDMTLELGNLHLLLSVNGQLLFRVGANLKVTLALMPAAGGLQPTVVATEATTFVLEEPVAHGNATLLETAIKEQIGGSVAGLLGDTVIALPSLGGAIVPLDVQPTAGGRYLAITLQ